VSEADAMELVNGLRSLGMFWSRLVKIAKENKVLFAVWLAVIILTPVILFYLGYVFQVLNPSLVWIAGWIPLVLPLVRIANKWAKLVDDLLGSYLQRAENERHACKAWRMIGLPKKCPREKRMSAIFSIIRIIPLLKSSRELEKLVHKERAG